MIARFHLNFRTPTLFSARVTKVFDSNIGWNGVLTSTAEQFDFNISTLSDFRSGVVILGHRMAGKQIELAFDSKCSAIKFAKLSLDAFSSYSSSFPSTHTHIPCVFCPRDVLASLREFTEISALHPEMLQCTLV